MIQPQGDPWVLRWDLNQTNFLDRDLAPAFLYYNPGPGDKRITIEAPKGRVRDLSHKRMMPAHAGKVELLLGPHEALVIEIQR
jgi:hypothetical protein